MEASNSKVNGKVVDCLYPIDADFSSKQKTLEIMKVMKGALSVAKSRTGEVIYRHNKLEDESLKRQLKRFDKAQRQSAVALDSRKRTVMRHWGLVFEKQKSMNESIREFDTALTDYLTKYDVSRRASQMTLEADDNSDGKDENEEETEEDEKKQDEEDIMSRRGIQRIRLQPIGVGKNSQIKVKTPTPEPVEEEVEAWPLENHHWISEFIDKQKKKHKKLITKNILKRIQNGLTKGEKLYRFQLRSNLAEDPYESINAIVTSRSSKSSSFPRMVKTAPEFYPSNDNKDNRFCARTLGVGSQSKIPKFLTSDKETYENYASPTTKFPPIAGVARSKTMYL